MRFQIKHLLLLTTAWAVLIATYLHDWLAGIVFAVAAGLLVVSVPLTLVVLFVAHVRQKSHPGEMDRVIGWLLNTIVVVGPITVVAAYMFTWHVER